MWIYRKQLLICFFANIGQTLMGYTIGWPAPMFSKLRDPEQFPQAPTELEANWLVAITLVGCFVGSGLASSISHRFGRKPIRLLGGVGYCVSYLGQALVRSIPGLMVFRCIGGAFVLLSYSTHVIYIGEIASTEIRGMLLGSSSFFINLGCLLVYSTGGYASYQVVNYLGTALGIVYIGGILFAPETPIYYIMNDREKEAKDTLLWLNRKEDAEKIAEWKKEILESTAGKDWKSLFTEKCNRRALMITIVLFALQQTSGSIIMSAYTTTIFEIAGSSVTPYIATIIIGVVQVLSGIINPMFVERCGRKVLLLLSTVFAGLSLVILAVYIYLYEIGHPSVAQLRWLPLLVFITYCIFYTFGLGILPASLIGEMFQMNVRSAGATVVMSVASVAGIISITSSGYILAEVGMYVALAIFSGFCFLAAVFTICCVPETKGKTLMEVQKMLSK